jgi:hypothetical protein
MVEMIEGKHEGVNEVIHIFHQIMQFDLQDSPNILTRQSVLQTTGSADSLKQAYADTYVSQIFRE